MEACQNLTDEKEMELAVQTRPDGVKIYLSFVKIN